MRRWFWPNPGPGGAPVAPDSGAERNETTIGADDFDETPQTINPKMYRAGGQFIWKWSTRPHPVLCGPLGPITVLPDHMHEGLCEVPANLDAQVDVEGNLVQEYPKMGANRLAPEVIATGHDHHDGVDFGLIATYDGHQVDEVAGGVGRVLVDATWHHFFDMNVNQFANPYDIVQRNIAAGVAPTAQNLQLANHWTQIAAYFRNIAVWLARKSTQQCIRDRGVWLIRHHVDLRMAFWERLEIHPDRLGYYFDLGAKAYDVFNQIASKCLVSEILIDILEPLEEVRIFDPWWAGRGDRRKLQRKLPMQEFDRLAQIALGGAMHEIMKISKLEEKEIGGKLFRKAMSAGSSAALKEYAERMMDDAKFLSSFVERRRQ